METMKGFYNISIGCFKIFLSSLLIKSFPMRITLEAIAQEQQFTVWFLFLNQPIKKITTCNRNQETSTPFNQEPECFAAMLTCYN